MKKILACTLLMFSFWISGCSDHSINDLDSNPTENIRVLESPQFFDSVDEFKSFIEEDGFDNSSRIKGMNMIDKVELIDVQLDGYTLSQIIFRENIYLAAYYIDDDYIYNDIYDEYANERLSTVIYEVSLFEEAQESLKINYIDKGFNSITIEGRQCYYMPEYTTNNELIGYEIAFTVDNNLIYIHLPNSGSFADLRGVSFNLDS